MSTNTHSIFTTRLPYSDRVVRFTGMCVGDEKLLLLAKQSGEMPDILAALDKVLSRCLLEDGLLDSLPMFEVLYLFIKVSSKSISNIAQLILMDSQDDDDENKGTKIIINLDKVLLELQDNAHMRNLDIGGGWHLNLRYPPFGKIKESLFGGNLNNIHAFCLESVSNNDSIRYFDDYSLSEILTYLDTLSGSINRKLVEWMGNIPRVTHTVTYNTKPEGQKSRTFEGIGDFFSIVMSYTDLGGHYKTNFLLMQEHKYSMSDIYNMMPFERTAYCNMITNLMKEKSQT